MCGPQTVSGPMCELCPHRAEKACVLPGLILRPQRCWALGTRAHCPFPATSDWHRNWSSDIKATFRVCPCLAAGLFLLS